MERHHRRIGDCIICQSRCSRTSEEGGRIPDIEVAHAGQGDGDGAAVLSEEVWVPDDPEDGAGEWQEMPADRGTMTKSQRRTWKLARARIRKKTQG